MKIPIRIVFALLASAMLIGCGEKPASDVDSRFEIPAAGYSVSVESSGSDEVDNLVRQLVSRRPAPYRSGNSDPPIAAVFGDYITPEVELAIKELKTMGPAVFPSLVKHLGDDRYSYSGVVAAWLNYTVSDAVVEVLCDGHYMHSGYKWRGTPSGGVGYLSFEDYLEDRGRDAWSEWAKTKTPLEIQLDFIDWCVAAEETRGFKDEAQRDRILGNYAAARNNVTAEYAEQQTVQ